MGRKEACRYGGTWPKPLGIIVMEMTGGRTLSTGIPVWKAIPAVLVGFCLQAAVAWNTSVNVQASGFTLSLLPRATTTPVLNASWTSPCILNQTKPRFPPPPSRPNSCPGHQGTHTASCCCAFPLLCCCCCCCCLIPPLSVGYRGWVIHSNRLHGGGLPSCSSPASLTPILLSPPSPGCWRRGTGKQNTEQYMASRPHIRVSSSYRTSWQANAILVGTASIARLRLCPCAVNLGTAEFLSDRGRWGRWIRRRRMRAQPRPTTAHSTTQYIAYSLFTTTAHSEGSLLIFLASADFLHQDQEEPSVAAMVPCQPNRCYLTDGHKYLPRPREGHEGGAVSVLWYTSKKKIRT